MGPSSDPYAVVNPRLQVYGIKSLRVVDSSIMPEIVAGHTNAAAFMIGEQMKFRRSMTTSVDGSVPLWRRNSGRST